MDISVFDDLSTLIGSDYDFLVAFISAVVVAMCLIFLFNLFSFIFKWVGGIK